MQVIEKDIEALIPYQNNPRNNEKAVGPVAESIKKFGFLQPIVIDKDNVVVCGHTRLKAAKKLKIFVMKGVEGFNNNAEYFDEDFEPIRQYMESEAIKSGLNRKKLQEITGVQMWGHWFTKSQFTIIPENHYIKLQEEYKGKAFEKPYKELREMFEGQGYLERKKERLEKRAFFNNTHDNMNNVWHFARPSEKEKEHTGGHATPKPLALCARAIKSSSREGEYVLDLFGGSGSTLMACEQLNRKCLMMELSPQYVDVIVNRWEHMTGNKAVLLTE